jgi:phytanoyl-CoA hydroxylase
MKLSPYSLDFGRILRLLVRPNWGGGVPSGPFDAVFPDQGYIVIRNAVSRQSCKKIIEEYAIFEKIRVLKNCVVTDENNRNYRLTNFHLISKELLLAGLNKEVHQITGRFFGRTPLIYTSLYFKHGSQQNPHVDTPFFWTQPMNMFCGVWLALEDVSTDAGPLIYYPGSQKYFSDVERLIYYYKKANQDVQAMFALMENDIKSTIQPEYAEIKAGDVFVWHPGLMHGGSRANVSDLTRNSVVFHFAPMGVNVRDEKSFLKPFLNYPKFGVINKDGLYYARGRLPAAMI